MTYLPTMGDLAEPISFNNTKYPGVCKPTNGTTLQLVYDLQNQCNRIAKMKGGKIIAPDGDIGPATLAAARFAAGYLGPWWSRARPRAAAIARRERRRLRGRGKVGC